MSEVQGKQSRVTIAESYQIKSKRVGEFLQEEFKLSAPLLFIGDHFGDVSIGPQETDYYCIFEVQRVRIFFGLIPTFKTKAFAEIWFSNESRRATSKKWVLEVYGRDNLPLFTDLANKLSVEFDVEVHIRLESEVYREPSDRTL